MAASGSMRKQLARIAEIDSDRFGFSSHEAGVRWRIVIFETLVEGRP